MDMSDTKYIKELISLEGKTSMVTGGAGHLGKAMTETLAELGSDIILVSRNEKVEFVKEISEKFNVKVDFEKVDLNLKEDIDNLSEKYDKVDVLINNFFTWPSTLNLENTTWDEFEDTLRSGITSPFYLTKKMIEKLKKTNNGKIINIGSMYGMVSPNFKIYHDQPNMGNALSYNASKAAMIQMTKYLAVYCAKWNIRVNCVSPGPFSRPGAFDNGKEWFEKELKEMNPLNRIGEPWELKGIIALLATELSSYMTGQNISVDGGWTVW
jgi:NAD(P)-dependent dehydrogenase (short-subunit alcohol dehydrogenase family)